MINTAILKDRISHSPWIKILVYFSVLSAMYLVFNQLIHQALDGIGLSIDLINEEKYAGKAYIAFLLHQLVLPGIILLGIWISRKLITDDSPWDTVGLSLSFKGIKAYWAGSAIALGMAISVFIIEWLFGWLQIGRYAWEVRTSQQIIYSIYITGLNWLMMAVLEELVSRGFVFQMLTKYYHYAWAILFSCCFSTIIYLLSADLEYLNVVTVISIMLMSVLFSIAKLRTGSLWMPIGLHFSWYFIAFNVLGLAGVNCSHSILFETLLPGPMLMVGVRATAFGPMGGLVTMAVIGLTVFAFGRFLFSTQTQKHLS